MSRARLLVLARATTLLGLGFDLGLYVAANPAVATAPLAGALLLVVIPVLLIALGWFIRDDRS